jgi:NAD(P)-dependent dehydrogenase (short-subunit alcohol dehydrogenase family)
VPEALAVRTAAITGGSRGIGFATARALVTTGARVALLARGEEELAAAARSLGESALPVVADVADPASVEAAFARIGDAFGRLDALVCNAAVAVPARLEDADPAELRRQVETNLLGPMLCTRAALPALRAVGGQLVYVSSDAALTPFPYLSAYSATKGGLEVLADALGAELHLDGIRVALVRPGPTLTEFARDWDPAAAGPAFQAWTEQGFLRPDALLEPDAVAESVLHVLSRPAGSGVRVLDLRPTPRS